MSNNSPTPAQHTPAGWYADQSSGGVHRWWDGTAWTGHVARPTPPVVVAGNGFAIAALVLGIVGFFAMGIPLFIGWFIGGPLDILAIAFGIAGLLKCRDRAGRGRTASIVAIVVAGISLLSVFVGAGSLW